MGIASLILGVMALLASWIPIIGFFWIPGAIIGIVLGIVAVVQSNRGGDDSKGIAVSGLVSSSLALISIIGFTIFWANFGDDLGSIEIIDGGIEQFPSEPAETTVTDGLLNFRTLVFSCELLDVGRSFDAHGSDRVCVVEFEVSVAGEESALVSSTNQYLLAERGEDAFLAEPGVETWIIRAIDGSCVNREVSPGSPQLCSARFENLRTTGLDEETIRYHSSHDSPGALVSLVNATPPQPSAPDLDPNSNPQIQEVLETN